MDPAAGALTNVQDQEDDADGEDGVDRLIDKGPGEFDAPEVPNDALNELLQSAMDDDSLQTNDLVHQPLPPHRPLPSSLSSLPGQEDSSSVAATAPQQV